MKKYYFPPIGFGLFYQLGALENINQKEEYELYGSSGGAIICLLSLLKEQDRQIKVFLEISKKIRKDLFFNYFPYMNHFLKEIMLILDSYDNSYLERKLKTIYIEVTEICSWFKFSHKFVQPTNLTELKDFVIASCYLPFVFWFKNPLYYEIKNKKYFDGFFGNMSNVPKDFIKIDSYSYASIVPLTEHQFFADYQRGKMYHWKQENKPFSIFTFIQITTNIIRDLLLYIPYNLYYKRKKLLI
jgi:hypothetical protein